MLYSEMIWKISEKVSWIVKIFGKYRRNVSWIVKRYEKYGRNSTWKWKDMEIMEKGKLNSEMI
jgi:hypothetical protein